MEFKTKFFITITALMVVGIIAGHKSPTTEYELCRRQTRKRLLEALEDPTVNPEQWHKMLIEEVAFLNLIAAK